LFGDQEQKKNRIPEDFFFSVFSGGIFHRNVVLERSQEFRFLDAHRIFLQEFLWDRNSCI
jgi:hypothetical protein